MNCFVLFFSSAGCPPSEHTTEGTLNERLAEAIFSSVQPDLNRRIKSRLEGTLSSARNMIAGEVDRIVVPGDLICPFDWQHKSGSYTYVNSGGIVASVFGKVQSKTQPDGTTTIEVEPVNAPGAVPLTGSIVLAKVISLTRRFVRCDIVAVGDNPLAGSFKGLIRREDIRATQRDQAEPALCYRPGDLIRARVINIIGPGITIQSNNQTNRSNPILMAVETVSGSVNATADVTGGTSNTAACLLSTAEPDLGVVLGLGRSPDSCFVDLIGSTNGSPLIPVSWSEMICPHTLTRFPRKVARVPDELMSLLVQSK